ncbi:MAG: hypothetical protein EA362_00455 [Saprospirales bacterium]|nr:MAG: hypothetical protein EA362_00455 [Saprospirales bacterium]
MLLFTVSVWAQNHTSGHLIMEIIEAEMEGSANNPEAAMAMDMLKGSTTSIYFTPEKEMTVMDMMGGMMLTRTLTNIKDDNIFTFMDMMGQRFKVNMGSFSEISEQEENVQIIVDKNDRKNILGFDCYKVTIVSSEGGVSMSMETYVTEDIRTNSSVVQGMQSNVMPGTIMKMSINTQGIKMVTKAKSFNPDFDKSVFDFDQSGYQEMDLETFQRMGMGF